MFRQEVVLATDRVGPLGSAGHKRCLAVERWLVAGRGDYKQQWLTAVLTVGCGGPGTVLASEQCSPRAVSAMCGVGHGHGLAINECWPEVVSGHQQCWLQPALVAGSVSQGRCWPSGMLAVKTVLVTDSAGQEKGTMIKGTMISAWL